MLPLPRPPRRNRHAARARARACASATPWPAWRPPSCRRVSGGGGPAPGGATLPSQARACAWAGAGAAMRAARGTPPPRPRSCAVRRRIAAGVCLPVCWFPSHSLRFFRFCRALISCALIGTPNSLQRAGKGPPRLGTDTHCKRPRRNPWRPPSGAGAARGRPARAGARAPIPAGLGAHVTGGRARAAPLPPRQPHLSQPYPRALHRPPTGRPGAPPQQTSQPTPTSPQAPGRRAPAGTAPRPVRGPPPPCRGRWPLNFLPTHFPGRGRRRRPLAPPLTRYAPGASGLAAMRTAPRGHGPP